MSEITASGEVRKEGLLKALAAAEQHYEAQAKEVREAAILSRMHRPTGPIWNHRPTTREEAEAWYDDPSLDAAHRRWDERRLLGYGKDAAQLREAFEGPHVLEVVRLDWKTLRWLKRFFE